jgi:hypothetical protein
MKTFLAKSFIAAVPVIITGCNSSVNKGNQNDRPNILIAIGDDISWPDIGARRGS